MGVIVKHKRSNSETWKPSIDNISHGEIALNYSSRNETLFFRNSEDKIVEL